MDGNKDLLAGDGAGQIWIFLNTGTDSLPFLNAGQRLKVAGTVLHGTFHSKKDASHIEAKDHSRIHYADWDGDGLNDLLIGYDTNIAFLKNTGTPAEPLFITFDTIKLPTGSKLFMPGPIIYDWNNDGLQDLIVGNIMGIYWFKNIGSNTSPQLAPSEIVIPKPTANQVQYGQARFQILDWNRDGIHDILLGNVIYGRSMQPSGNLMLYLGK
ncbi:VCBS repeat-containing protein [bacterium]|nr:VCBS repeat-containing protein [bacterium]